MIKKVIYVSFVRLSDKVTRDLYIDYLISKGAKIEYWDVTSLLVKDYDEVITKSADYLRIVETYRELEDLLQHPENKDAFYMMAVTFAGFAMDLYRLISKYKCRTLYIVWGAVPVNPLNKWIRLLQIFSNPVGIAKHFYFRQKAALYRRLKLVRPFDIVFAGGEFMQAHNRFAARVIPINSSDYDQYRQVKLANPPPLVEGRYAVFLDVYLTDHPDNKVMGWSRIAPDPYFGALNRFFERLEEKFGIEIVIAAHPKADYRNINPFNGRRIIQNCTPQLVKDCTFVVSHSSLSQSQAILNQKPIVFVYTTEMTSVYKHTYVNEIYDAAAYLDAALYNIDEIYSNDQIDLKKVDLVRYENYKYSFLVSRESEHKATSEIFWNAIKNG